MTDLRARATTIAMILALAVRAAHAAPEDPESEYEEDEPTPKPARTPRLSAEARQDIVIETPGERSTTNITVLVGITTVSLVTGLLGLHYHMSSRDASDAVSAQDFTGRIWTQQDQTNVDHANRDRLRAIVFYGAGGACLLTAIVMFIATNPASETTVIHPHTASLAVVPIDGGALVGGGWRF